MHLRLELHMVLKFLSLARVHKAHAEPKLDQILTACVCLLHLPGQNFLMQVSRFLGTWTCHTSEPSMLCLLCARQRQLSRPHRLSCN